MYYGYYDSYLVAYIVIGLLIAIGCCVASGKIAGKKGHDTALYYVLGFLIPIVGIIAALAASDKTIVNGVVSNQSVMNSKWSLQRDVLIDKWYLKLPFEIEKCYFTVSEDKTKALLTLRMRNFGDRVITSVYFKFRCFDDTWEKVCENNEFVYAYQDLHAGRYDSFGNDISTAIILPDAKTRNVDIEFEKISFEDGSVIWAEDIPEKEFMLKGKVLEDLILEEKVALANLANMNNHFFFKYHPITENKDKWMCACGKTNLGTDNCEKCNSEFNILKEIFDRDYKALAQYIVQKKKDEERRAREEATPEIILNMEKTVTSGFNKAKDAVMNDYKPMAEREIKKRKEQIVESTTKIRNEFKGKKENNKICLICGTEIPNEAEFCPECGNALKQFQNDNDCEMSNRQVSIEDNHEEIMESRQSHESFKETERQIGEEIQLLKQLKNLLDTGILTQDEFDTKKKQILNRKM